MAKSLNYLKSLTRLIPYLLLPFTILFWALILKMSFYMLLIGGQLFYFRCSFPTHVEEHILYIYR